MAVVLFVLVLVLVVSLVLSVWVFHRSWQAAGQTGPQSQRLALPRPAPAVVVPARARQAAHSGDVEATPVARTAASAAEVAGAMPLSGDAAPAPRPIADVSYLPLRNASLAEPLAVRSSEPSAARSTARTGDAPAVTAKSIRPVPAEPLDRVRAAIADGSLAEAEALLQGHLAQRPKDRIARELLVGLMLRGDRIDDASRQLEIGLRHHPAHGSFLLIHARLLAQRGDRGNAIRVLRGAARVPGIRAQRLQMLGALYQQDGRYAEAAEQYRVLLALQPRSAAGWVGLAISRDAQGSDDASAAYRRALAIGGLPSAAEAYARQRLAELD